MKIKVCIGKTCKDRFSKYILTRLKNDKEKFSLKDIEIEECMCLGNCKKGPNIVKNNQIINYANPAKASEILLKNKK